MGVSMPSLSFGRNTAVLLTASLLLACAHEPSAPGGMTSAGERVGSAAASLAVTAVSPDTSNPGVTLDVRVKGSGFRAGAVAAWALDGVTDEQQVRVNRTTYVSARELVANVTIAASARSGRWDVIVIQSGKNGVGTESAIGPDLFEILDPSVSWLFPLDDAGLALRSDRKWVNGAWSEYRGGACGVLAKIYATTQLSNSGDATMDTDYYPQQKRKCAEFPRTLTRVFEDGTVETGAAFTNLNDVHNTTSVIPVGVTVTRALLIHTSHCGRVMWGGEGGDSVLVTRVDASTWDVQSQADPRDRAWCESTGMTQRMPVRFRIVSHRPLN